MKAIKKITSVILTIVMVLGVITVAPFSVSAANSIKTQAQAVDWLNSQNYATYDFDGAYGTQCVEFVKAYVNWLMTGNAWQDVWNRPTLNGNTIWQNSLWSELGWTVYYNTPDFMPQPGDIFSAGTSNGNHTGVVISSDIYSAVIADANARDSEWSNGDSVWVHTINWRSASSDHGYGATHYIRPNFSSGDTSAPTISNARVENVSANSFDIKCDLSDNIGVTRVWLNIYGPNGSTKGYSVSASNGAFSHTIYTSDYAGAGLYSVHIYAFDSAGNETGGGVNNIYAVNDTSAPTISNARVENVSANSFDIKCDLSDNIGVTRVWLNIYGPNGSTKGYSVSASNGAFSHTIYTSDYAGAGLYSVHIYAFDSAGNETGGGVNNIYAVNDTSAPTISNARVENVSANSFDIKCDLSDNIGVTRVWLNIYGPNGSTKGYSVSASNGAFSHTIYTSDYTGAGLYSVHIYAFDAVGNQTRMAVDNINAINDTGDINQNNTIDISDATELQKHLAQLSTLTDEQLDNADTNGNGSVDIQDVTTIQKHLVGAITYFPKDVFTPKKQASTNMLANIYFDNSTSQWNGVNIYLWSEIGGYEKLSWPGENMSIANKYFPNYYVATVDTSLYDHMIFAQSDGRIQTADLYLSKTCDGKIYSIDTTTYPYDVIIR